MKKLLIVFAVILVGCTEEQMAWQQSKTYNAQAIADDYDKKRVMVIDTFKTLFPENWEQKLLEYDLQQASIQKQQQALYQQQELMRQDQNQQIWQNFWVMFNENYQRELDRQAYGRQPQLGPIIYPGRTQNNSTYWQEQQAQQEYYRNWNK